MRRIKKQKRLRFLLIAFIIVLLSVVVHALPTGSVRATGIVAIQPQENNEEFLTPPLVITTPSAIDLSTIDVFQDGEILSD